MTQRNNQRRKIMKHLSGSKALLATMMAAASLVALSSVNVRAQTPDSCVKRVDLATLGPKSIIGQGPNGEKAASVEELQLSADEAAKVKAGKFKVGITMQTVNLDWSQLQVQGVTETLNKYGVEVIGVTSAEYQVDKQIANIEDTIQRHPDGIISIPVDGTATAATYKKVSAAGIKLVFMDNVPPGMKHPDQYASMISADSQGNGQIAAQILASCVPQGGTIGVVNFGVDYFSTNERTKGVHDWMAKNRPDIKMKQTDFTDPSKVAQIAGDFLTANPDVKGLFAVWDQPALDSLTSMRAQSVNIPVTTVDLGLESSIEIAKGGPLKATGSQRPYDQGVAEALAMMKALVGQTPPAWVGVQSLPVVQSNVLESYKTVFKKDPPAELVNACKSAKPACG
jgi:ribose transport system substrate-binding protein